MPRQTFKDVSEQVLAETMEKSINPMKYLGFETHIPELNDEFGSYGRDWMILIGGPQKSGKSAFAATTIGHFGLRKLKLGIVSCEMSNAQYVTRIFSGLSGVTLNQFRDIDIKGQDWGKLQEAGTLVSGFEGQLDDEISTIEDVVSFATELRPDVMVIDYGQLLSSKKRHENRVQELYYISRTVKMEICKALNCCVILLLQLNQENSKSKNWNTPYAYAGAGAFKNDCDLGFVIAPYIDIESKESPIYRNMHLVVSRHSELMTSKLAFIGNRALMTSSISSLPNYVSDENDYQGFFDTSTMPQMEEDLGDFAKVFI